MKKSLLFLLICLMSLEKIASSTQPATSQKIQLRDSIFETYQSIADVDQRMHYLRVMFYNNVGETWAIQLLDSAISLAIDQKNNKMEINIRGDYYWHYKFQSDLPRMEQNLSELKAISLKFKLYTLYFQEWCDMLQFYNIRGDTEYARMQALKMEKEAREFNSPEGLVYAQMSLGRALTAAKKEEEGIRMYREALKSEAMRPMTRSLIHFEIVSAYQFIGKDREAVEELRIPQDIIKQYLEDNPQQAASYQDNLLELELAYCTSYQKLNDTDNLLKHLNEAKKYYTPDCFFANYISYHTYWGAYYQLTKQWDKCFREFDIALAHFDGTQPLHKMDVLRMKGKALVEAERHKEAALLYKELSYIGDSLNHSVLQSHQEVLQANYNIRKALLDKQNMEKQHNWIAIGLVVLLILIVAYIVFRTQKVYWSLRHAERETRNALEIVDNANKMKEVFLRNITHQIRGPLNVVVGFSEILATEKGLDAEQTQEYSVAIKKNANLLFELIIDVLDLSRLESGMMKFNVSECDAVGLCREAWMTVKNQDNNPVELTFETDLEELPVQADMARFLKMLLSLLAAPEDFGQAIVVKFTLTRKEEQVKIVVENSPLLLQPDNIQRLKHDINQLFLEIFKGTYQLPANKKQGDIVITYPLSL